MLTAPDRVSVETHEAKDAGHRREDPVTQRALVTHNGRWWRGERTKHANRYAGPAAGRIDGALRGPRELADPGRLLPPTLETIPPQLRGRACVLVRRAAMPRGVGLVDPGPKVVWSKRWKREQKVAQVALRVDGDESGCRRWPLLR